MPMYRDVFSLSGINCVLQNFSIICEYRVKGPLEIKQFC